MRVPGRLRHDRRRLPPLPRPRRAWPSGSARRWPTSTSTTCRRSPRPARRSATLVESSRSRRTSSATSARHTSSSSARRRPVSVTLGGALQRHGRGPARRVVRRAAGDLPQRAAGSTTSCMAIKEVFASLYNDRAIAYRVHSELDHDVGGALGRRPADGALRHRRLRRDVHHGHRVRLPATPSSSPQLRPRRGRRAGRRQPRRVLRLQAGAAGRAARRSSSAGSAARPPRWSTRSDPRWGAPSTSCRSTRPSGAASA